MKQRTHYHPLNLGNQQGFSIVELLVAIAIGMVILAGMVLIFANTSATRQELDRTNRQIENGRYAMEVMRDDIQLAGFYGEVDVSSLADPAAMPDLCAITLTERTAPAGGVSGVLKLHVQGINDYTAGTLTCLTGANVVKPGTDVIVVRRVKPCVAGAAGCDTIDNARPYMQVNLCNTLTATHALALGSETFGLQMKDCSTAAPLRPYVIYLYFVGTDNVLKRAEFTGSAMGNVISLVEGIENLQIDYGVDTSGDGAADSYAADPGTVANWGNVVTARLHLLARNTEVSPAYTDTKTYSLGTAGTVGPFNDAYRRHVYSSLVRIVNVSAKRETP